MTCLPPNAIYLMLVGAAIALVVLGVAVTCALLVGHVGSSKNLGAES